MKRLSLVTLLQIMALYTNSLSIHVTSNYGSGNKKNYQNNKENGNSLFFNRLWFVDDLLFLYCLYFLYSNLFSDFFLLLLFLSSIDCNFSTFLINHISIRTANFVSISFVDQEVFIRDFLCDILSIFQVFLAKEDSIVSFIVISLLRNLSNFYQINSVVFLRGFDETFKGFLRDQ